jgi:hypothetical protein
MRSARDPVLIGEDVRVSGVGWSDGLLHLYVVNYGKKRLRCSTYFLHTLREPDRDIHIFAIEDGESFQVGDIHVQAQRIAGAGRNARNVRLTIDAPVQMGLYRERRDCTLVPVFDPTAAPTARAAEVSPCSS